MSDNLASTAAEELKKWLEVLEKYLNKMESDKASLKAAEKQDAMLKEIKAIKENLAKSPEGPEKDAVTNKLKAVEEKLDAPGNSIKAEQKALDGKAVDGPGAKVDGLSAKPKTGQDAGFSKGENGKWNKNGTEVKDLAKQAQSNSMQNAVKSLGKKG
ncbi:hypothetical protein EI77_02569 [Prosthecobacter fusiformis]|uniref:Uncharacterized protein n=1 Tax=Prosthecobacter fusiformis TaxID=48464 RepID=A0A4R7S2F9_9BACT|nr:hypothetical protein [Prosthecobacter fusiformis]TDU71445.1 hypothetical protein EI77_02569 [Prosthecobacter fusiformis]